VSLSLIVCSIRFLVRKRIFQNYSLRVCIGKVPKQMDKQRIILLVEDSPDDTELFRLAFKRTCRGGDLRAVGDGEEALGYLTGSGVYSDREQFPKPHLMLLDLGLPHVTGFEILQRLRTLTDFKTLPVIAFSGSEYGADVRLAYELGANCFLKKPNSFDDLIQTLTELCNFWLCRCELPDPH
jgi:two-component system response regulator